MNGQHRRPVTLPALIGLVAGPVLGPAVAGGETGGPRPRVGTTIFPLYDIARQVAGPVADVVLVLPPGASLRTFEPTPAGVRSLTGAWVLFSISGLPPTRAC